MDKVKIKIEYPPNRCEICHKADYFDLNTLSCKRCKDLPTYNKQNDNNYEFGRQEEYFKIFSDKEYSWKGYSNEVNKQFGIALAIMIFNLFSFTVIFFLETIVLGTDKLFLFTLNYPSSISLCLYFTILTLEFRLSKILTSKPKFVSQGIKFGSLLTIEILAILFTVFKWVCKSFLI